MTFLKSLLAVLTVFIAQAASAKPAPHGPAFRLDVRIECTPQVALTDPVRVGWDVTLNEIQKVVLRMNGADAALELKLRYLDSFKPTRTSTPVERETTDGYNFVPQAGTQKVLTFVNTSGRNVQFESVQFMFGEIDSPPSEGPIPEGSWPANASLILISWAHYTPAGAKTAPAVVTNVPLACTYTVKY